MLCLGERPGYVKVQLLLKERYRLLLFLGGVCVDHTFCTKSIGFLSHLPNLVLTSPALIEADIQDLDPEINLETWWNSAMKISTSIMLLTVRKFNDDSSMFSVSLILRKVRPKK